MTAGGPGPVEADADAPLADRLRATLQGSRVALEPLSGARAAELLAAARDGELFTWLAQDPGRSSEAMDAWLAEALVGAEAGLEVPFAIVSLASGRAVGSTRFLELRPEHRRAEIGWTWLAAGAWGTGINVEAKLLLLAHAFERAGLRRVEFKTDARNARSRGALEALGARFEGIFRKHMVLADGRARDSAYYSVIDDDWPELRRALRRRLSGNSAGPLATE